MVSGRDRPGLYQPRITRLPSLLCLFTITVALIAVIELACRRLPSRYPAASAVLLPRDGPNAALVARHPLAWPQEYALNKSAIVSISEGDLPHPHEADPTESMPVDTAQSVQSAQPNTSPTDSLNAGASLSTPIVSIGKSDNRNGIPVTSAPSKPAPSNFLPVISTVSSESMASAIPSDDLSIASITPPDFPSTAPASNYLSVTSVVAPTPTGSDYLSVTPIASTEHAFPDSDHLSTKSSTSIGTSEIDMGSPGSVQSDNPNEPTKTAMGSAYLSVTSITPPTFPSTAPESDYLTVTPVTSPQAASSPPVSDYLPIKPDKTAMESDDTSRTLGAPPSDYLTVTPVTSPEAASLPPVSEYLSIPPDFSASGSDYLSITSNTPPTFPSTAPASDYLTVTPVSPTQPESAPFYPSPSDYLTVTPVTPPQVASSAPASDYLTITPVSPSQGESAPFYPSPSDYLTVTRVSPSEVASSDYLSVSPIAVTQVTAVESNYLPVTPSIQQTPHVTDYLPISPDIFTPTEPASDFLPVPSGYMPISSTDQDESVLPYIIIPSAYLPVKTKSPSPSDPVVLPIVPSPDIPGHTAGVAPHSVITALGNNKIDQQSNGPLPTKDAKPGEPESFQPQTGIFQGETYSMGQGGIFIGGKSFATASPTTATLPNGKTVILGPSGVSVQNAADVLPITKQGHFAPSQTGIFQGESYSMGRDGIVIGGKSFAIASPTTATLANGKTVILGPGGVSVQNAADVLSITQQGHFAPSQTGIFQGESYSMGRDGIVIGGKSFATASPTTATLLNGKTVILGPSGVSVQNAADVLSIIQQEEFAPKQTGIFQGVSYSIGPDGIIIDGKSFATASPTTATLPNGKLIILGPSGLSMKDAADMFLSITRQGGSVLAQPQTGIFHGMPYSLGSDGAMLIDGKSFAAASPTTATLPNGKILVVGPSGVSVQNAPDFDFPITKQGGIASPKSQTGMFHGMPYSIGSDGTMIIDGKSFAVASPTTATLPNGKVLIVGPTGVLVQDAADVSLPITRKGGFAPQTGLSHGEAYSMGPDGTIVIGEKSFATASPTTATLPDGKVVIVGPNGVSIQDTTGKVLPPDVTNAPESLPQTGMFHGESYSVGPSGVVVLGGKSFTTASPTTATLADGKIVVVGPSGVSVLDAANDSQTARTWVTPYEYVVGGFLPTIIAVIYSIPWYMLASALQEIQPFYQLQSPDGVTAEDSIGLGYRTSTVVVATFTAMRKGHHLVWWSGLISTVNLFIAPLATGTVFIGFTGICTASSGRSACFPTLSVYPIAARVLQALLAVIALLTLVIAVAVLRKRSGVYANPLSIAGLATLFQNQQVVEDFRRLNPYYSSSRMIKSALRENRYQLGAYVDDDGTKSYGFKKCYSDVAFMDPNYQTSFRKGKKYASVAVAPVEDHGSPKKTRTLSSLFLSPITIVGFGILVIGLETLVIYYNRTGGNTGFERWMDSQSFGVSFTFTAVGVVLKLYWTLLDEETRNMEPYRQLLTGGAKAGDSILLAPHTNPYTGVFYSLRNKHYFNAYLSLVAILCEPLIVALSNIPFKASSVLTAYKASTYITIGVLSMMLIGIVWMLCRHRSLKLVRRPDTIASILLFLCGSGLLDGFKGMSRMRRKQRDATVKCWDKTYAMGSVMGVDGVEREGIDESLFVTSQSKED